MFHNFFKLVSRFFLLSSTMLLVGFISKGQILSETPIKTSDAGKDTLFVVIANNIKIDIKRTILGNTKKIIGKKVIEFRSYKIEFKNPKKLALKLTVQDLIPTSKDGQVELEILESSDAEIDFTHGRLAWSFILKPNEKKVLEVKYNVTYPKNRNILGIQNVLQLKANIRKTV